MSEATWHIRCANMLEELRIVAPDYIWAHQMIEKFNSGGYDTPPKGSQVKEQKASCCEKGRQKLRWNLSGSQWWHMDVGSYGYYQPIFHCPFCGAKLEPPKPPRKIVLDEEARRVIEETAEYIESVHEKCPPGRCLRAETLRSILTAAQTEE